MVTESPQEVGRLLALLEKSRESGDFSLEEQSFSNSEKATLSYLNQRLTAVQSARDLAKLPSETDRQIERLCLNRAIDIFLFRLFVKPAPTNSESVCEQLFRELNNNYYCFEQYSDMIRSYYHASREFQSG